MWLEAFVLKRAEERLRPYRVRAKSLKRELAREYDAALPRIEKCSRRATYWHGTGRYHYAHSAESRYEQVNTGALSDVLDSIIDNDGLMPHLDPWIESGGKTVSLATVRMHARLFARAHLYERSTLRYELGSPRYWVRLYMFLLFFWLTTNLRGCRAFLRGLLRRSSYRDFQTWASAVRKPRQGKVVSMLDVLKGNMLGSDIRGNYPILIGVAGSDLLVRETIPLVHAVEVRSLDPVTLADITHIEVPLENVQEAKAFLARKGAALEVLPLEFVDLYMSGTPVRDLAYT